MTRKSVYEMQAIVDESKKLIADHVPLFVFDTETTGLKRDRDRILSFSALKIMKEDKYRAVGKIDLFINPGFSIPSDVTEINHISDETVAGCPFEDEAAEKIRRFLGESPFIAGYNSVSFDQGFLNAMYLRAFGEEFVPRLHLDVFRMAKEKLDLPNYKLQNVSHELGTDMHLTFHRSIDDVIATAKSMILLLDMYDIPDISEGMRLSVTGARYWGGYRHDQRRIYVSTKPYTKTYYDICGKVWRSDRENVNLNSLRADVLNYYQAETEADLVKMLKTN